MEEDLLCYLLAAFPAPSPAPPDKDDDFLVIHGYRVPFESPVDDIMLGILADVRRNGFGNDATPGIGRG